MPNDTFSGQFPPTFMKFERQDAAIRDYLAQYGFKRDGSKGEWEAFYAELTPEARQKLWPGLRDIMRKLG